MTLAGHAESIRKTREESMDKIIEISASGWGITLNSAPLYFNISWGVIIVAFGAILARKILKSRRGV